MSWTETVPADWRVISPRRHFRERKEASSTEDVHLTPSQHHGVLSQTEYMAVTGSKVVLNVVGADSMKHVEPGDAIAHLRSFQGGLETAWIPGKVSTAYTVIEPLGDVEPRYFRWVFKCSGFVQELASSVQQLRDGQSVRFRDLAAISLPMPPLREQRRIADFLDDRVGRLDRIIAARRQQAEACNGMGIADSFRTINGQDEPGPRSHSGLAWLGDVPEAWPVLPVGLDFQVDLGKMLDEKRRTGMHSIPYLRNTNVQWDVVSTDDLKTMDIAADERARYSVERGDLLVCEGGQPGRAAVWDASISLLGYQKALHRVRSRGRSRPEWLLECLRVAAHLNVFAIENGQTTIGHLTKEQLRAQRFPLPDSAIQSRLLASLRERAQARQAQAVRLSRSIDLLIEYKSSLITAAVTGQLDVTTAGSGIPNT